MNFVCDDIRYLPCKQGHVHGNRNLMSVALSEERKKRYLQRSVMKACVFRSPGRIELEQKPVPKPGPGEALIEVRLTSICETDTQILNGDYAVKAGLTLGHEAVGVIRELGSGVSGYEHGQRVLIGAVTSCGQCESCLGGHTSQCCGSLGGWRLGNSLDGTQAEYVLIPHAQANLAIIPNALSDEQVLPLAHVASTGFASAERAVKMGDTVAVFMHGPVGLCAMLATRLRGAGQIIALDRNPARLALAWQYGATSIVQLGPDPVPEIERLTHSRGVDVACVDMTSSDASRRDVSDSYTSGARGAAENFESALRVLRPGGTLLSVGVSCGHLKISLEACGAAKQATCGADRNQQTIATTLCPGGEDRLTKLMRLIATQRVDLSPLVTHLFTLDEIVEAYELVQSQQNGVLKVGIRVR